MADFITMTCKSCGGKLQITPEIDDFACMYCGTEFKVNRGGGMISLSPVAEDIKRVSISTDKTASELALVRLKEEIEEKEEEKQKENMNYGRMKKEKKDEIVGLQNQKLIIQFILFVIVFFILLFIFFVILSEMLSDVAILPIVISLITTPVILCILVKNNPFDIFRSERINEKKEEIKNIEKEYYELEIHKELDKLQEEKMKHKKIVRGGV